MDKVERLKEQAVSKLQSAEEEVAADGTLKRDASQSTVTDMEDRIKRFRTELRDAELEKERLVRKQNE